MGHGAATLKDVAQTAGVSTATVARVVHERGYVAPQTRSQVVAAIAATGYQLNVVAQGLRTRRTLVLGHLLLAISPNPFFANVAVGVEEEAARLGCGVIIANTQDDTELERLAVITLIRRRVDAVIFSTVRDADSIRAVLAAGIPAVQVERQRDTSAPAVTIDNYFGTLEAMSYLVTLGHRRIAFVGESPDVAAGVPPSMRAVERERVDGYRDGLSRAGISLDNQLVDLDGRYFDLPYARYATARLLDLPNPPTAIFAACDMIAAGVLQELYGRGRRVPHDVSVVGYDDTLAPQLTPPLTTVAQPMIEAGRLAASIAITAAQSGQIADDSVSQRLTTHLVVRSSTGPPPTCQSP